MTHYKSEHMPAVEVQQVDVVKMHNPKGMLAMQDQQ